MASDDQIDAELLAELSDGFRSENHRNTPTVFPPTEEKRHPEKNGLREEGFRAALQQLHDFLGPHAVRGTLVELSPYKKAARKDAQNRDGVVKISGLRKALSSFSSSNSTVDSIATAKGTGTKSSASNDTVRTRTAVQKTLSEEDETQEMEAKNKNEKGRSASRGKEDGKGNESGKSIEEPLTISDRIFDSPIGSLSSRAMRNSKSKGKSRRREKLGKVKLLPPRNEEKMTKLRLAAKEAVLKNFEALEARRRRLLLEVSDDTLSGVSSLAHDLVPSAFSRRIPTDKMENVKMKMAANGNSTGNEETMRKEEERDKDSEWKRSEYQGLKMGLKEEEQLQTAVGSPVAS
ncbi:hypothetical protein WR25_00878 [Diploscapter pachys]|uniref:Uncharacterized protein n=1 Tax=Diploscapter pachys TaxID=2018661 RepID=A0A2A2KVQ3_9BILA|nr:hypothetical protein WR25_00878 [Diploscapter pachys]